MDFLHQFSSRVSSAWRRLPQVLRVAVVTGGIAAAATAGYWGRTGPAGDREWLFGGVEFAPQDLARMEAAFGRARLGEARVEGRKVNVPAARKDLYLKALADHQALPDMFYAAQERALDGDHPFATQKQREGRMKLAREQEAALIVRKIRGIEEVCVQYDDFDAGEFPRRKRRRATVAVRASEGRELEPATVQAIRSSIMTAVGVSKADDITVLDLNAGRAYDGGDEDLMRRAESDYAAAKRRHEERIQARLRERLAAFPGAIVTVNVELDRDESHAATYVPSDVRAAVSLPRSALTELWRRERPAFARGEARAPEAFELRRIEESARKQLRTALAPVLAVAGETHGDESSLQIDVFADEAATDGAATAATGGAWHAALAGKEWAIGLALAGIATAAFWAGRRDAGRAVREFDAADDSDFGGTRRGAAGRSRSTRGGDDDDDADSRESARGDRLRGELADRVKLDPRSAAETVKQWLGNVA